MKRLVIGFSLIALAAIPALAARPLSVDEAETAEPGVMELDAGVQFENDPALRRWETPVGLTAGLRKGVDASVGFGGQWERREMETEGETARENVSGVSDVALGLKVRLLESCPLGNRHAVAAGVNLPAADEEKGLGSGETDYSVAWLASRELAEGWGAHLNIAYTRVGGEDPDIWWAGLALDCELTESLQAVGEITWELERSSDADPVSAFRAGLRWSFSDQLTFDAAVGGKIEGDAPDVTATVGFIWSFSAFPPSPSPGRP